MEIYCVEFQRFFSTWGKIKGKGREGRKEKRRKGREKKRGKVTKTSSKSVQICRCEG